jgi:succinate-acetate transporter protein
MIGFLMALTPTCINLLGWRGSGGSGAAYIGAYYWFGGAVMLIGSILEFILGNTLTYVVFTTFGAHWYVLHPLITASTYCIF